MTNDKEPMTSSEGARQGLSMTDRLTAQQIETPQCDALNRDALDSNDIRAWRSLAYRLEQALSALQEPDRVSVPRAALEDLYRYGMVHTVTGVRYGQSHNERLAEIERLLSARPPDEPRVTGEALARRFHEVYERLAPSFGYETRTETRQFDPTTPNGRLMIAVCSELSPDLAAPSERGRG